MSIVKFKKEKQEKVKILSKIISIIAIIGKVFSIIAVPFILLSMILIPLILNNIDIKDNKIIFNGDEVIELIEDGDKLSLKYDDEIINVEDNSEYLVELKNVVQDNSKGYIIIYVEFIFVVALVVLSLMFIVFHHLEKLFKNIHDEYTPFTLINVDHIKKIAYLLIAVIAVPLVSEILFGVIFKRDLNIGMSVTNILEILFLFVMAYIFEYGYEIQLDSKGKMYGDENE